MGFLPLIVTIRGGSNKLILDLCLRANPDRLRLNLKVISQPTRKYACYPINTKWGMYCTDPMLSIRGLLGLENANHAYIACSNAGPLNRPYINPSVPPLKRRLGGLLRRGTIQNKWDGYKQNITIQPLSKQLQGNILQ